MRQDCPFHRYQEFVYPPSVESNNTPSWGRQIVFVVHQHAGSAANIILAVAFVHRLVYKPYSTKPRKEDSRSNFRYPSVIEKKREPRAKNGERCSWAVSWKKKTIVENRAAGVEILALASKLWDERDGERGGIAEKQCRAFAPNNPIAHNGNRDEGKIVPRPSLSGLMQPFTYNICK